MTKEQVEKAFGDAIKRHSCPSCGEQFTDSAVAWGNAWCEGYHDHAFESGQVVRDGPFKIRCELCEARWLFNYFGNRIESVPKK